MNQREPYDLNKAPNVAPRMNGFCGQAVASALEEWLDLEIEPDLTPEERERLDRETQAIRSWLNHLNRNLEYRRKKLGRERV